MKKDFIKRILFFLIIDLIIEIFIFNISSFSMLFGKYEKKVCDNPKVSHYNDDGSKVFLLFENINTKVVTFKIEFCNLDNIAQYKVLYKDETSIEYNEFASSKFCVPNYNRSNYMPLRLSGETDSLLVEIDTSIYEEGKIDKFVVNERIPIEFNFIRFTIIFEIALFLYCMKNSELFNINYSIKNFKQESVLLAILVLFFASLLFINYYSINDNQNQMQLYNKEFVKAVTKGKFSLLIEPSEELLKLKNPYDTLERYKLEKDVDYLWDTAYYNGNYYIYFGILPLLIIFLPFHLITKEFLDIYIVVFVLSVLIFILLKEILVKLLSKYFDNVPFKLVVCLLIILCSGSLILYANGLSRMYELVILFGLYFVLQGLFFIIKSMESDRKKYINIFLGSLCLALSVACRPTDLLVSIIIIPYLIYLLVENVKIFKENKKPLIKLVLAVGIPYIVIGSLLMWYNYVRFENVFEFGAKYQLTVANMESLSSRSSTIFIGLITNLFNMPFLIPNFPFIINSKKTLVFYGYYFVENMLGGLFMLAPICFMNFCVIKVNKITKKKELRILINTLLIVAIIITIVSIMLAGSAQRYLIDYAWIYIISAILIFMIIYNSLKSDEAKKILQKIIYVITIYTCIIGFLSGIVSEKEYFKGNSPQEYYKLEYRICFWE